MFSTYSDFAPLLVLMTLTLSFIIAQNITQEDLKTIDGILAFLGLIFGFFMTTLNLIYTSMYLFLLSPIIAVSCATYLRYRGKFNIGQSYHSLLRISNRNNISLSIIWWLLISGAVLISHFSEVYTRHPLFFLLISGAVALLGIQVLASNCSSATTTLIYIVKIIWLSVVLRYSAYFVSPYPVGSDPWAHREYISYFLEFGRTIVPPDFKYYYVNYPIAHLHAVCTTLLTSISPHNALFLLGVVLTLSTILTFLIVRMLTGNVQLALMSMLLLNFTDAHIQWSIQVLAMSFGIALYSFIIYFALKIYSKPENKVKSIPFMLVFLCVIVWTHTISAFITLVSLFALIVGYISYDLFYVKKNFSVRNNTIQILSVLFIFLTIIMTHHWMDSSLAFFDVVFRKLFISLSQEAEFLGTGTVNLSSVAGQWGGLLRPLGFCIYTFFGIIGALYCLSDRVQAKKYLPLVVLVFVLFSICYGFPIFGMTNIIPDRWPAFAFISFVLFIGVGIFCSLSLPKTRRSIFCVVTIFLLVGSFFMITNSVTNQDSPLYGEQMVGKLIWTESEMNMFIRVNKTYNGNIIADEHTHTRPFDTYLRNRQSKPYVVFPNGTIDRELLSNSLVIWRRDSLTRPVQVRDSNYNLVLIMLEDQFRTYLDSNYNCILDTYTARGYLPR